MDTPISGQFTAKLKKKDKPNQNHGFIKIGGNEPTPLQAMDKTPQKLWKR